MGSRSTIFSVTPQGAVGTGPVAGDDTDTVAEDALLTRDAANGLLGNDNDPDGPFNAVAGTFETTEGGTITIGADGSYTYMAPSNFAGTDTVDYPITDGTDTDTGTLTVTVNAVADEQDVHAGASDCIARSARSISISSGSSTRASTSAPPMRIARAPPPPMTAVL